MQILKYAPLFFAALAAAAPAWETKRDDRPTAATIIGNIGEIKTTAIALNDAVTPLRSGLTALITALRIAGASQKVSDALTKTTDNANKASNFNDEESINIGLAIIDLNPIVINTLDNLKSKVPVFRRIFLTAIVRNILTRQKSQSQALTTALVNKVGDAYKELGQDLAKPLIAKFDEVIAAFR